MQHAAVSSAESAEAPITVALAFGLSAMIMVTAAAAIATVVLLSHHMEVVTK